MQLSYQKQMFQDLLGPGQHVEAYVKTIGEKMVVEDIKALVIETDSAILQVPVEWLPVDTYLEMREKLK